MSVNSTSTLEIIEQTAEATFSSDILLVKLVFNGTESFEWLGVPLNEFWKDISWYFDKYAVNDPYAVSLAEDSRTRIAKSLAQIFEDLKLARYDEGGGTGSILWVDIIDSGSPASQFHQIPWEYLERHTPWKNWGTVVVRRKFPSSSPETVLLPIEKTNFNILCVVARKHISEHSGLESDIAYHNVAIPIVDAVGRHPFVNVYLSRPGTFQAFQEHLDSKPEGFYDIIHFDLHGTLRGKNTECRPFLGFAPELPTSHGLNYIEASRVAQVLVAHKACVVTLNACYSAHGGATYSNLARTFVQYGVPRVLGMSYTLVESAAPLLVSSFFRAALLDTMPFSMAAQACRRALANDQVRASRFGKTVQLDDFLVPVLYYSGLDISMKFTKAKQIQRHEILEANFDDFFTPFRLTGASASPPERSWRWRNDTPSLIGFTPRDMDILSIERNILCSGNGSRTLMLYGPAGTGKTSLLLYLADWWEMTNFILGSSYIDFDADDALNNPQTVECILAKLVEDIGRMSPIYPKDIEPEVPSLEKTLAMIRRSKHLIAFDHVEAAFYGKTCQEWCSDLPVFPHDAHGPLKNFVEELIRDSGESIVIISTRRKDLPEKWLPGIEFRTYELSGLPLFASIEIAAKILSSNGSEQFSMDDLAFIQHLVQLLDCNPGALEVVLPFLAKIKKSPEHLFRLLLSGRLFADSRELIRMECPPSLFINLGKLMYNTNRSVQKVILFTSQLWKRMPREPKMFDTYIILAATDFNIQDLSVVDNFDLFEVKELREKLRRPTLDPTMGHACYTVSREVQQVMVDLGWWILETDTYYRVNPLLQIFLQRRRTELDLHQQSFTQLEEAIGTEVARVLQYIPPPLSTESFERAFVVYHGLLRSWFPGLLTVHFDNVKGIVQKEFYNLIKALDLAAHSLSLLDRCWPHELAGFLASFALIPGILSKTEKLLVNSSIERILEVYEMQEQKYNPPALPGQLLDIVLGLFHIIASYYSVSKPFESWIKMVDRSLAVAERARAVHGPLPVVSERKRRNLLESKGQQLKARGDLQAAKEIFRDNLDSALQLDVTDEKGPEGLSYQSEYYTRLAVYLSLPNLSDGERQQASRQARKAIINVIKISDNLELSTFMEHSILLRQDDDFTPLAELPTRPVIPRSSFETGYPELLEELQVNRSHDEGQRARRRAQKESDLERALQSFDAQEQIRCQRALANWAFIEKDFQRAEEHCRDLLKFRDTLSPIAAEKANNMILLSSVAKMIPEDTWKRDPETTSGRNQENTTEDSLLESKALAEQLSALSSMTDLASKSRSQGRWKEAEELFKKVIERRKKVLGPEHPSTLSDMVNLASTYWDQGLLEDAENLELQVMMTRENVLGAEHPDTISAMNNLASTLEKQGKKEEATELGKRVLEKRKIILGEEHIDTISAMSNLAMMLRSQDKLEEAEIMMRNVVDVRKRIQGEQHPHTILAMINLAAVLHSEGRYDEAVEMCQLALQVCEKALSPNHRLRLMAVNNLGASYSSQGKLEQVERTYQLALQTFEKALGPNHASVLSMAQKLCKLYESQGRLDEAEKMSQRALQASGGALKSECVGIY